MSANGWRSWWRTGARAALLAVLCVFGLWGCGVLWFQLPLTSGWRVAAIAVWGVTVVAALWGSWRRRGRAVLPLGVLSVLLVGGWLSLAPQQDREWADDVAQPLRARIDGDVLVVENVRNFHWRGEQDYDARWEWREYPLDQLRSADLVLSYWMGPAIAHTLVSFGFADGRQLVFSLEIRKERGESFSALGGFFRKFEVVLVAADERDIVHVRSNVRGETVYLYRLYGLDPDDLRSLLRGYVEQAQQLERAPRFYNTLTSNCTTVVYGLMRKVAPALPLDWRLLASGYLDEYAYDVGGLAPGSGFAELKRRGNITARARAAGHAQDFSRQIRDGVPGMPEPSTR